MQEVGLVLRESMRPGSVWFDLTTNAPKVVQDVHASSNYFRVLGVRMSLGRFFTEALRTDALMLGPIRIAQLVSVAGILAALIWVPVLLKRSRLRDQALTS